MLTYGRPSKKCKDFMKNFPNNFDLIFGVAVVKLRFHVAVAVAVGQTTARRGMPIPSKFCIFHRYILKLTPTEIF